MKKIIILMLCVVLLGLTGCKRKEEIVKMKDLDFTICDESKMPKELIDIVNEKKENVFKLTFNTKDYLFIVVGYGQQNRSNLSVTVEELYMTKNAIYIDTNLISDETSVKRENLISYPYVVVKCENYELPVLFK